MKEPFIPFHVPLIESEEIESVTETLRSGWLTSGPKVKRFESEFADSVGAPHAVMVNSCTAAMHLALEAIGTKPGDEVIVPTMTFAATAEVVLYFRARPVLVDSEPDTLNLDSSKLERLFTPRTKAIIAVHYAGHPCEMEHIHQVAASNGIRVLEDAAHAFPAYYKDRKIGSLSEITCFSFYATKTITTGEGGAATTADPVLAERMRMMSLHGISHDAWKRYTAEGSWYYEIAAPGYKYNMTDVAAAIGIEQLKKADRLWKMREGIAGVYNEAFSDLPELTIPTVRNSIAHAWHLYVLRLNLERLRITRGEFVNRLKEEGIGASVHFIPLHLHPFYRNTFGYSPEDFPIASAEYERILSLPIYPGMTPADVGRVAAAVKQVVVTHRR